MLPYTSLSYTLNHILLLRLLMAFPFKKVKTLHNFLYIAAAKSKVKDYPAAYVFIKLKNGAFNYQAHKIIEDFKRADFFSETDNLFLNKQGKEIYYSFAPVLKYHKFPQVCLNLANNYGNNLWQVNHEIYFNPSFKEKKVGEKIIFRPETQKLTN